MKAAVMFQKGEKPQYTDFHEPIVQGDNELLICDCFEVGKDAV